MEAALESLFPSCRLYTFESGEDFIEYWESRKISMKWIKGILLDYNLLSMSGQEILEHFHSKHNVKLPAYILSGTTNESLREEMMALGAIDLVEKPMDFDSIISLFKKLFSPLVSSA